MSLEIWRDLAEDVRRYPSPHNSQPIKLLPLSESEAKVYYDLDLGLPEGSGKMPFEHATAGIFLEALRVVAAGHGFHLHEQLTYRPVNFSDKQRLLLIATVSIKPARVSAEEYEEYQLFMKRQTSRLPYENKAIEPEMLEDLSDSIAGHGSTFHHTEDPKIVKEIVRANQATLFEYVRDEDIHRELLQWLRFSDREAAASADGLSSTAMIFPGPLMRFAMSNPKLWDLPGIGQLLRFTYMRTTQGVRYLGWLEAAFKTPQEAIEAGRMFMRLWLRMTANGLYLHPFGTVITSPVAHKVFADSLGIQETESNIAWMLFRFGNSKTPPQALRRPASSLLIGI